MATKCVGIDIGSYSIKVAEVDATPKSYVVKDFFLIPVGLQNAQDQRIQLIEALQKIAAHFDLSSTRVVVGLPQADVTLRRREFPFKERFQLLKALPFELEDDIPLDPDDAVFDAKIIGTHGANTDVLAAVAYHDRVKAMIDLLNEVGLDPDVITVDSFALANNFELWNEPPKSRNISLDAPDGDSAALSSAQLSQDLNADDDPRTSQSLSPAQALISIGHRTSLISIFWDGNLITARSMTFGGHDMIEAIQGKYAVPQPEAQKIFQERAFVLTNRDGASHDQIVFSDLITEKLKAFIGQIKLTILEIESELRVTVQSIGLLGGSSHILNLAPFLTSQLALPVNITRHLQKHPRLDFDPSDEVERVGAIAIGLAIEGFRRPRNPAVNFRKGDLVKQNEHLKKILHKWKHVAALAGILFVTFSIYAYLRDSYAADLDAATQDHIHTIVKKAPYSLSGNKGSISGVQKFVKQKEREAEEQRKLAQLKDLNSPIDIIKDITGVLPDRARLQLDIIHLAMEEDYITIEGEVANGQQSDTFKNALQTVATDKIQATSRPSAQGKTGFVYRFHVARLPIGGS
jgi:general secretion pathway protein L